MIFDAQLCCAAVVLPYTLALDREAWRGPIVDVTSAHCVNGLPGNGRGISIKIRYPGQESLIEVTELT